MTTDEVAQQQLRESALQVKALWDALNKLREEFDELVEELQRGED